MVHAKPGLSASSAQLKMPRLSIVMIVKTFSCCDNRWPQAFDVVCCFMGFRLSFNYYCRKVCKKVM